VYLLHVRAVSQGGYPVFYVGKSDDLRRRLEEHSNDRKAKPMITAFRHIIGVLFSAAPVENPWNLDAIESGLIRLLRPPCNDQVPGIEPILVNLPPAFGQSVN
jgi:excinuclease UvrABC nuclease subunit